MKLLVVDDSSTARKVVASALTQAGYQVETASSGQEALNIIETSPPFDLITLDLMMEGLDGYETCLRLRSLSNDQKAETPVIFITGKDTMEGRAKGFAVGGTDFLSKENLVGEVGIAVDRILRPDAVLNSKVLVVDDSSVVRKVMVNAMKEIFTDVDQADNGMVAFEMIQKDPSRYDFIVLDHDMPEMTGTELTRKVRTELGLKDIPMVLVTGTQDRTKILDFFSFGGTDCLMKPYLKEELQARIRAHVDKAALNESLRGYVEALKGLNNQKDDYLAACSHDLKTPLNAIIGFTQLVLEDLKDEQAVEDLQKVIEASDILHALIGNITDLYRVQTEGSEIEFEPFDVNELLSHCVSINQSLATRKGVELRFKPLRILPLAMGNKLALTRVINNLLSNALKFTEKGGVIELKVKAKMDHIQVLVKDSGIGMDEKTRANLFQKFSKSSKEGTGGEQGIGLGLMITQQIVEQHGSEIEVASTPGEGSEFSFLVKTSSSAA